MKYILIALIAFGAGWLIPKHHVITTFTTILQEKTDCENQGGTAMFLSNYDDLGKVILNCYTPEKEIYSNKL